MTATLWRAGHRHWEMAAARTEVRTVGLSVDRHRIDLQLAGEPLAGALLPAFGHLVVDDGTPPDLSILAWDTASTGIDFPVRSQEDRLLLPAWRMGAAPFEVPLRGLRIMDQPYESTLTMLEDSEALYWTSDASALPTWERAAPLLHVLHWWFATRGIQLIHAGAVGRNGRGVIVVGPSGSGKSTTVLSGLCAGMGYVGDDRVLLDPGPPPRALHLFASAKLTHEAKGRLAEVLPRVENPERVGDDKALYLLKSGIARSVEVRAIIAPTVTGQEHATLEPITPVAALRALAPNTIVQFPGAGARALAVMRRLCSSLPCFRLSLGSPESAAELLNQILAC